MEVGEVGMTAPWLSLGKHAQRNARESACHLGAHQAAVHGSQLVELLSIERIVEEIHLAIASDAQLDRTLAQARHALHHIVDALQLAAQCHLLLGYEKVEMTVVDLIDRQTCLYLPLRDNIRLQGEAGTLLSASYEGRLLISVKVP